MVAQPNRFARSMSQQSCSQRRAQNNLGLWCADIQATRGVRKPGKRQRADAAFNPHLSKRLFWKEPLGLWLAPGLPRCRTTGKRGGRILEDTPRRLPSTAPGRPCHRPSAQWAQGIHPRFSPTLGFSLSTINCNSPTSIPLCILSRINRGH